MSRGYTAVPVVDDNRVIGIVTEANLMQGQIDPEGWRHPAIRGKPRPQTVHQVMTVTPVEMSPDADLADVVSLMLETNARSVPLDWLSEPVRFEGHTPYHKS